jgi:hypothetical protein
MIERFVMGRIDIRPQDHNVFPPSASLFRSSNFLACDVTYRTRDYGHPMSMGGEHARKFVVARTTWFIERGKGLMYDKNVHNSKFSNELASRGAGQEFSA